MLSLQSLKRPSYGNVSLAEPFLSSMLAEVKHDGIWCFLVVDGSRITYYSAALDPKNSILAKTSFTGIFAGEYMFGSNWAHRHGVVGKFYGFDTFAFNHYDLRAGAPLVTRRRVLEAVMPTLSGLIDAEIVQQFKGADRLALWDMVKANDFEGLVFKDPASELSSGTWYRAKVTYDMDYVCTQIFEGNGRLSGSMGAIEGSLFIDGKLVPTCAVGGGFSDEQRHEIWANKEKYIGQAFTAIGWKIFPGGALRHPNFKTWRDDKRPEDCTWTPSK